MFDMNCEQEKRELITMTRPTDYENESIDFLKKQIDVEVQKSLVEQQYNESNLIVQKIEKCKSETSISKIELEKKQIELLEIIEKRQKEKSSDDENFVYRFNSEVARASVDKCIEKLATWSRIKPKCHIEIIFSSPGGYVNEGFELYDFIGCLRAIGHTITTGALGIAASMAGILLQCGDIRYIGAESSILIHKVSFGFHHTSTYNVETHLDHLKQMETRIVKIFASRSNMDEPYIEKNWNRKDWWIGSEDALKLGIVDVIRGVPSGS